MNLFGGRLAAGVRRTPTIGATTTGGLWYAATVPGAFLHQPVNGGVKLGTVTGVTIAAELCGARCLAAADALHLGRVQRVDLGSALALLLMADPQCEIEQLTKAILECGIALDLAANITDDAAAAARRTGGWRRLMISSRDGRNRSS